MIGKAITGARTTTAAPSVSSKAVLPQASSASSATSKAILPTVSSAPSVLPRAIIAEKPQPIFPEPLAVNPYTQTKVSSSPAIAARVIAASIPKTSMTLPGYGATPVSAAPSTTPGAYAPTPGWADGGELAPSQVATGTAPPVSYAAITDGVDGAGYGDIPPADDAGGGSAPLPDYSAYGGGMSATTMDPLTSVAASTSPAASTALAKTAPVTAVTTVVVQPSKSLWKRFLSFFGLGGSDAPVATTATVHGEGPLTSQASTAGSLVRRARAGDQNAMATIDMIRQNAASGSNPIARTSMALIWNYIRANPVPGTEGATMGAEPSSRVDGSYVVAVKLAMGPPLSNTSVCRICEKFSKAECNAFVDGMYFRPPPKDQKLAKANAFGRAVADARKIQAVRAGAPIAMYDHASAWELGEAVS